MVTLLPLNQIHCSTMSTRRADIPKKRKRIPLYDGSDGVSYSRPPGITSIRISKPYVHPFDLTVHEVAAPGRQKKRPHFDTIKHSQFAAYEEQARQEAAARKAGECCLTCISTWANLLISPPYVVTASSC